MIVRSLVSVLLSVNAFILCCPVYAMGKTPRKEIIELREGFSKAKPPGPSDDTSVTILSNCRVRNMLYSDATTVAATRFVFDRDEILLYRKKPDMPDWLPETFTLNRNGEWDYNGDVLRIDNSGKIFIERLLTDGSWSLADQVLCEHSDKKCFRENAITDPSYHVHYYERCDSFEIYSVFGAEGELIGGN
ncbi:MAG: hypothetical protein AABZ06_10090 [Bdellovibrionota bacterium]